MTTSPLTTHHSPTWEPVVRRLLLLIALYTVLGAVLVQPVVHADGLWWHLRIGQWIVDNGTVPQTDPLSAFGQGKPWVAYSWLFDLLVYELYRGLGLGGLVLYRVVLSFAVAVALHRLVARLEPRFFHATALTTVAFVALVPLMSERPWMFTILFAMLTVNAILDLREGKTTLGVWLLPVIYILWANLHVQFVYGLLLLVLACAAPAVDRLLEWNLTNPPAMHSWRRMILLTTACAAATLVNPYHVRVYGVVFEYAAQQGFYGVVDQFNAISFRTVPEWVVLLLAGTAAFALGRGTNSEIGDRRRFGTFEFMILIVGAIFSFHCWRDLWFVVLASILILGSSRVGGEIESDRFTLTLPRCAAVAAAVLAVLAVLVSTGRLAESQLQQEVGKIYPAEAAAFLEKNAYPGPLFNDCSWGGYLAWRLPRYPVSMDDRTNLHGDERILRSFATWEGMPGWENDPDLQQARLLIAAANEPLTTFLRDDSRYRVVHEDEVAVVFVRAE